MSLSPRQNNFLLNLLTGMPQHEAYEKAGYQTKDPDQIRSNASILKSNKNFQKHYNKAIAEIKAKITKPLEVTRDRILNEYSKLAFLDPRQFYDNQGNLVPIHKLNGDTAAAIAGLEVKTKRIPGDKDGEFDESITAKIKMSDKKGALDSLSRILGMFDDKVKVGLDLDSIDKVMAELPEEFVVAVKAVLTKKVQGQIGEK